MFRLRNRQGQSLELRSEDGNVVVEEEAPSLAGTPFLGDQKAIIFREGFHYPARFDADGEELGPDLDQKLVWRDGGYHHALPAEPSHFHRYGIAAVDLSPGSE